MGDVRASIRKKFGSLLAFSGLEAGKLPPQVPELEQAVLGAAMLEEGVCDEIGYLLPEHFYVTAHNTIWAAITAVHDRGANPNILLVTEELKQRGELDVVGGAFYISQLSNKVASSSNVDFHARIVVQKAIAREHIAVSAEMQRDAYDDTTDIFELHERVIARLESVMEVTQHRPSVSMEELATDQLKKMDEPAKPSHTTGYPSLDKILGGGWQPGDLVVVSARPGQGKTAFATAAAIGAARTPNTKPSLFFQLEINERNMNNRGLAAFGGFSLADLTSRKIDQLEMRRLHEIHTSYSQLPIFFNFSTTATWQDLRREVARYMRMHDIGCVYIDQANWIRTPDDIQVIAQHQLITRSLRRMAKDFDIPVVLLHQMSREIVGRNGHAPRLSDLKNSGSYEEDSQVVVFVHRPEYYNETEDEHGSCLGRVDLIVAKHSNGPVGTTHVRFVPDQATFTDDWQNPVPHPTRTAPPADRWTEPKKEQDNDDLPF